MTPYEYAKSILVNGSLESKTKTPPRYSLKDFNGKVECLGNDFSPVRNEQILFSDKNVKFPKVSSLKEERNRGKALHFFANHELLAIEIMAYAILTLPETSPEDKKIKLAMINTIREEQIHFNLYEQRMSDFGISFGDFPLNDFFWQKCKDIKTIDEYLLIMSLTFEAANLDFCHYYISVFKDLGDARTVEVLERVLADEIKHVALGAHWEDKRAKECSQSLWDYYKTHLPFPLTPARAKGIVFNRESRELAGLDNEYISKLEDYRDEFAITDRKAWKETTI